MVGLMTRCVFLFYLFGLATSENDFVLRSLEGLTDDGTVELGLRKRFASRPGRATTTNSCGSVRGVPYQLRRRSNMGPNGLGQFYQKYTEAYGIPVLGSGYISNDALKRACYIVRFLFADRADVRQSYYAKFGRFALMGVNEQTTNIPEHAWLGPSWNQRARGLGATETSPVSTGGEENALCWRNRDRYPNEDIVLHEYSHGLAILGVKYAIPGFYNRLKYAYNSARRTGKWAGTYSMSTHEEYWAEAVQSYFNANDYSAHPNGIHGPINTRSKLRSYDPTLFNLIREVFPCGNTYLSRCANGNRRQNEMNQRLKMNCVGGTGGTTGTGGGGTETGTGGTGTGGNGCTDDNQLCASWATRGECRKNPAYMLKSCKKSCNQCGGSSCKDYNGNCSRWAARGECTRNPVYMNPNCRKSCNKC